MKNTKSKLLFMVCLLVMASCSSPKYTYKFDYHDYNAGRKEKQVMKEVASNPGPVEIQPEMLVAEAPTVEPAPATDNQAAQVVTPKNKPALLTLSKSERKEMIKELKKVVRESVKLKKAGDVDQSAKALDYDLKMSLIFFILALLAGLLYPVNATLAGVVGLILFIVAIVFFIKWIAKQ